MKIDAHQHFWHYDPQRDHWIDTTMGVLKRDYLPEDYREILRKNNFKGSVAIQADPSRSETEFLLQQAADHSFILGVVGWLDLCSPQLPSDLEHFTKNIKFKGIRHLLQSEPEGFMLQKDFYQGVALLREYDLTYDILVRSYQLEEVIRLVNLLPQMRLVIDHLGKPDIRNGSWDSWSRSMKKLGRTNHLYVKLSGLATEDDWKTWSTDHFRKYVDVILENFGPERIMLGSDWPVCLLAGKSEDILNGLLATIEHLSGSEQEWILGKTAEKFYHITN